MQSKKKKIHVTLKNYLKGIVSLVQDVDKLGRSPNLIKQIFSQLNYFL